MNPEEKQPAGETRAFIRNNCLRYWPYYALGFALLVLTNYITVLIPLRIKQGIELFEYGQAQAESLMPVIGTIVGLSLGMFLVRSLSRIVIFIPGRLTEYELRNKLYRHLMQLSSYFYRRMSIGDVMSRAVNDLNSIRLMVGLAFLHIMNTVIAYVLVFGQMVRMNIPLTLCAVLPIPLSVWMVKRLAQALYENTEKTQQGLGQLTDVVVETLGGIHIIKSFAAEKGLLASFEQSNQEYRDNNLKVAKVRAQMFPYIGVISSVGNLLLFIVGGFFVIEKKISLGDFVAYMSYIYMLAWPTAAIAWIISIVQRGKIAVKRINVILNEVPEIQDGALTDQTLKLEKIETLDIKNLSFRFKQQEEGADILRDISFSMKSGEVLGIFGPTGSGKTTLGELLVRTELAPPRTIFINGRPLEQWPLAEFRKEISYVPQSSFLFSQSIGDNIAYGELSLENDEQKILESATQAQVLNDIDAFPQKEQTLIGERGVILSGGQRNRIALARALYKPFGLLVMDDVLSAVDHKTEQELIKHVMRPQKDQIKVIMSHRISALVKCDRIIVLEQGKITASGTHEELVQKEGIYQHTWIYQQSTDENRDQ